MDISRLVALDPCTWSLPAAPGRAEARFFGTRELVGAMDEKVMEQLSKLSLSR